jgi:PPE-repeat protein
MNFAALPPEVNSGRMYAGPGSGPMRAAAAAWAGLAAELDSTATSYESVVAELTGESWLGPSSASMAAAAEPYVAWMSVTAGQAEQAATQANAAAAAYEEAFAATVPPPVIAANRAQLVSLVATNFLGQNTAAIAATEAHYGEMWAQDAAAMYGYAASSAAAAKVTPFAPPQQTTNSAGLAGQAAAVAHATGSSAGTGTQAALSRLTSTMPSALHGLASPTQATSADAVLPDPPALPAQATPAQVTELLDLLGLDAGVATAIALASALTAGAWAAAAQGNDQIVRLEDQALTRLRHLHHEHHEILGLLGHPRHGNLAGGQFPAAATMGQAVSVGGLSAPPSWAVAAPEIRASAFALPATDVGAAPAALAGSAGTVFSQMALAGMAGSAFAGAVSRSSPEPIGAITQRARSPQRPLAGPVTKSPQQPPASPVTGIAADHLRELALAVLHDARVLTDEEFTEKRRLLGL